MRTVFFLICTLISSATFADSNKEVLKQAEELVEQAQYHSAYSLLHNADPNYKDKELILARTQLAINYYGSSVMHHYFGFVDLDEVQSLEDVREAAGKYALFMLKANVLLDSLIKLDPEDMRLYKALGDYYYEVYLKYGDEWFSSAENLLNKIRYNYQRAIDGNTADYESYFVMGFIYLNEEEWEQAATNLEKSIKLNPNYPPTYYNLAYAQLKLGEISKATRSASQAWKLYEDNSIKADVARMLSVLYDQQMKADSAVLYIQKGLQLDENNYPLLKDYLRIALRDELANADSIQLAFFKLAPDNPTIYNILSEFHYEFSESYEPLISFFEARLKEYSEEDISILANLNFFKAQLLFNTDMPAAKELFREALTYFKRFKEDKDIVFEVIEQYLEMEEED